MIVIVGTALGSFGMMSFLILLGVYKIFPRPYDLVGPHLVLAVAGALMCALAWRQFEQSARLGLIICSISLLAIVADSIKTGIISLPWP